MGIGSRVIDPLIRLRSQGYLGPGTAVMEIGAQQLANSLLRNHDGLGRLRRSFALDREFQPHQPKPVGTINELEILDPGAPPARDFWQWLGFDYASIDIDGADQVLALDLNYDSVPAEAKGKYRLVTNFGTTEHVANQLN